VAKAEWTSGKANPRFIVTSLPIEEGEARIFYEGVYCQRGDMENRIKECQMDLFADRTPAITMRTNQLRLWFASFAYVLLCALRRIALAGTELAAATCGTIRLRLLKIGALVTRSVRRIKIAFASACPIQAIFAMPPTASDARRPEPHLPPERQQHSNSPDLKPAADNAAEPVRAPAKPSLPAIPPRLTSTYGEKAG
jgi:hypothetical protein